MTWYQQLLLHIVNEPVVGAGGAVAILNATGPQDLKWYICAVLIALLRFVTGGPVTPIIKANNTPPTPGP